jgi:hypothetical protein
VSVSVLDYIRVATVSGTTWSYTLTDEELSALQANQADFPDGYTFSVAATDAAGNTSAASTVSITVDTVAPTITSGGIATDIDENGDTWRPTVDPSTMMSRGLVIAALPESP